MNSTLPDSLPGHWNTAEGASLAREYVDMPRERLAHGGKTDMEVAFEISMTGRGDLAFEGKLAMAKDRIRWLSAQLAARDIELASAISKQQETQTLLDKARNLLLELMQIIVGEKS